jgi:endo-1,4-beta-D-glucanase Y
VAFPGLGIWYYRSRKTGIQPADKEDKQSKKSVEDVAASVTVTGETQPPKKANGIDNSTGKSAAPVVEEDPNKQAQIYNTDISLFHQNRAAAFEQLVPIQNVTNNSTTYKYCLTLTEKL